MRWNKDHGNQLSAALDMPCWLMQDHAWLSRVQTRNRACRQAHGLHRTGWPSRLPAQFGTRSRRLVTDGRCESETNHASGGPLGRVIVSSDRGGRGFLSQFSSCQWRVSSPGARAAQPDSVPEGADEVRSESLASQRRRLRRARWTRQLSLAAAGRCRWHRDLPLAMGPSAE